MKNLLYKELKLAKHPTTLLFLCLSAMVLIPNYPYYVTFFYTALGIFFICLGGRENHDIYYTMSLPVRKRDIVRARISFAVGIELVQALLVIPFALLRATFPMGGNQVGMDANTAFFGLALAMLGIFNFVFFTKYYKNPDKVGKAFVVGSIAIWIYMIAAEVCAHAVPFVRDRLDTADPQYMAEKLAVLGAGAAVFALLTLLAYRISARSFDALDL